MEISRREALKLLGLGAASIAAGSTPTLANNTSKGGLTIILSANTVQNLRRGHSHTVIAPYDCMVDHALAEINQKGNVTVSVLKNGESMSLQNPIAIINGVIKSLNPPRWDRMVRKGDRLTFIVQFADVNQVQINLGVTKL